MIELIPYVPVIIAFIEVFYSMLFVGSGDNPLLFMAHLIITVLMTLSSFTIIYKSKGLFKGKIKKQIKLLISTSIILIIVLLLGLFRSTDIPFSFKSIWRYAVAIMMTPASVIYFMLKPEKIYLFVKNNMYGLFIYVFGFIVFSLLKFGVPLGYGSHIWIYGGGIGFFNIYPSTYMMIFVMLIYFYSKKNVKYYKLTFSPLLRNMTVISLSVYTIIMIMIGKRDYVLMIMIAILVYILATNRVKLVSYIRTALVVVILMLFIQLTGFDNFIKYQVFNVRHMDSKPLKFEGRYLEYSDYINEIRRGTDIKFILFGKEIFNSQGKFFQYSEILPDRDRVLHSDVTQFLYGVGITGLVFFLIQLVSIYVVGVRSYHLAQKTNNARQIWIMFLVVYAVNFAVVFTGGMFRLFDKVLQFQIMGVLIAMMNNIGIYEKK